MSAQHRFLIEVEYQRDPDDRRSERYEEDGLWAAAVRHEDVGGDGDLAENIAALGEGRTLESVDDETGKIVTARRADATTAVDVGTWISIAGRQLGVERPSAAGGAFLKDVRGDQVHLTAEQLAAFGYRAAA